MRTKQMLNSDGHSSQNSSIVLAFYAATHALVPFGVGQRVDFLSDASRTRSSIRSCPTKFGSSRLLIKADGLVIGAAASDRAGGPLAELTPNPAFERTRGKRSSFSGHRWRRAAQL